MKKALVLLVLGLMMGVVGYGQGTFIRIYESNTPSYGFYDVTTLSNGNYVCTGYSRNFPNYQVINVIYDQAGYIVDVWQSSTEGLGYANTNTSDGGFAIAGTNGYLFTLIKYNSNGDSLWSGNYSALIDTPTQAYDLLQSADDGFVIVGSSTVGPYVLKTDSLGAFKWKYTIGAQVAGSYATHVFATNDGGYLVTGITSPSLATRLVFALKLDSNGSEEWIKTYNIDAGVDVNGIEMNNGGFVIAFNHFDGVAEVGAFLEINANGDSIQLATIADTLGGVTRLDDLILDSDGSIVGTGELTKNGFRSIWIFKLDSQLNKIWTKSYGPGVQNSPFNGLGLKQAPDKGYIIAGKWDNSAVFIKTDSLGNIPLNLVRGRITADNNLNCSIDSGETFLSGYKVQIQSDRRSYGYSDINGEYYIQVYDTGQAIVNWFSPSRYWTLPGCQPNAFTINLPYNDTLNLDIFAKPLIDCPDLTVSINTPFLRRCFQNTYTVNYCNNGTLPANSPYLEIDMDPYLNVDSASIPWVLPQSGNIYRFNIDTVGIGECASFNLWVTVDCDSTELGQTHCVSAHIYPDSICLPPNPDWDGSSVKVSGKCATNDSLDFKIKNVGASDMTAPSFFLIAEDNVMYQSGNFQLLSGDSLIRRFKGNGSTYTLIAQQVEGHPGNSFPMVSIEGCGVNSQGTFSKGFVTQYPLDDRNGFIDILCLPRIGSYDPNDKRAEPQGLDNEGYITASQPLDYTIRFQNTGTDTAFTVVLRDTLSPNLDITTLYLTGASHPYTFQIIGSNVLEWTFPNILLPDSNTNEPLSHGFVSFHIQQTKGNAPGTEITNRAGIYFDFNAVVLTNTTLNTIINDYKTWFTFIQSPESKLQLGIYPNPNNGTFSLDFNAKVNSNYEFVMYDLAGVKQFGQTLTGNTPYILQPDLPTGMYIYQLLENGIAVNVGKVVVNR